MTSIKPPSPGLTGPQTLPDVSGGVDRPTGPADGNFQATLDQAQARASQSTQATAPAGVTGTTGADPVAQLARAVESGATTLEQAVETLLGQTLARAQKHLTAPQLAELSGLLRDALMSDPTLSALRNDQH
jgi:hypothetical protein